VKRHKRPQRSVRPAPVDTAVTVPYAVMRHSHGASARLDAMEEAARLAIIAGRPGFRIVKAEPKRKPPFLLPADLSGLVLGPDGHPLTRAALSEGGSK
jgi:hypothetical protein